MGHAQKNVEGERDKLRDGVWVFQRESLCLSHPGEKSESIVTATCSRGSSAFCYSPWVVCRGSLRPRRETGRKSRCCATEDRRSKKRINLHSTGTRTVHSVDTRLRGKRQAARIVVIHTRREQNQGKMRDLVWWGGGERKH